MMYWTNKSSDETNNNFNNTFYIHIWNEKDQNLNLFIPLVSKICAHCYASLSLVGRGVVKWRPHWQAFPFSCLPVGMLKLKLGELFDNIHFVAIIDNLGNNWWRPFHVDKLQLALMEEDSKKQLQQKGVNEVKIFAKWDRRNNGLSLFIPSIFLMFNNNLHPVWDFTKMKKNKKENIVTIFLFKSIFKYYIWTLILV
jgi:hypothetical protein